MTLAFAQIEAAAERLKGHIERTPCRHSKTLSQITGAEVWVKFENLQFTASFKERGALNKLLQLNDRNRGVIAASAGNHSQGLAFHGQQLGIPVTIVMPRATPFVKVQQTRDFGAEVVLDGETYEDASARAQALCDERDLIFVHPFNDVDVMAGQGTIAMEMLEDAPDLDILPVPIGGGGLIAGVATAAKHVKPEISVVGVEPASFPSFTARMRGLGAHYRRPDHRRGHPGQAGRRPHLRDRPPPDRPSAAGRGAIAGTRHRPLLQRREDRLRRRRRGLARRADRAPRYVPWQEGRPHPHRRQHRSRLLASVLTRELVREKRLVSLKIVGDDRPGLLANVSAVIGGHGANIVEVAHNRLALDVPAKGAEFDIMIETRDARHTREVVRR